MQFFAGKTGSKEMSSAMKLLKNNASTLNQKRTRHLLIQHQVKERNNMIQIVNQSSSSTNSRNHQLYSKLTSR